MYKPRNTISKDHIKRTRRGVARKRVIVGASTLKPSVATKVSVEPVKPKVRIVVPTFDGGEEVHVVVYKQKAKYRNIFEEVENDYIKERMKLEHN